MIRVDLQDGDIRFGVSSNDLSGEFALVSKRNLYVRCSVYDVIVCEDVAVRGDDHAGAQALLLLLLRLSRAGPLVTEKLAEERIVKHGFDSSSERRTIREEAMFTTSGKASLMSGA